MYNWAIDDKNYNNGRYWLRSLCIGCYVWFVRESGRVDFNGVDDTIIGVVPALTITINQKKNRRGLRTMKPEIKPPIKIKSLEI